jgi:hypothetical protein
MTIFRDKCQNLLRQSPKSRMFRKFPCKKKCLLLINAFRRPGTILKIGDCLIEKDNDDEPPVRRRRMNNTQVQNPVAEEPVAGPSCSGSGALSTQSQLERLQNDYRALVERFDEYKNQSTQEIDGLRAQLAELRGQSSGANTVIEKFKAIINIFKSATFYGSAFEIAIQ